MSQNSQGALAPFAVRSFRFQWPADLAASWAFEIEMLILGWYVLVQSQSVLLLVVYGALQFAGALVSPYVGVLGDRLGYKRLYVLMRGAFVLLSLLLLTLAWLDLLNPVLVVCLSVFSGILKPSDIMIRYALIAQTLSARQLVGALGISRMTVDSARFAGAVAGVGIFTMFGLVATYIMIVLMYGLSLALSTGVAGREDLGSERQRTSAIEDLKAGIHYVWSNRALRGCFFLAFWVNLFAYPLALGLLPYVVHNVFQADETLLGFLGASYAFGSLLGSLLISSNRIAVGAGRLMILAAAMWFGAGLVFALNNVVLIGELLLALIGVSQSLCVTPLAAVMLRETEPRYRGRVMGMRILAVLGLPLGLLASGPLIEVLGFALTWLIYSTLGLLGALSMIIIWQTSLWSKRSLANQPTSEHRG